MYFIRNFSLKNVSNPYNMPYLIFLFKYFFHCRSQECQNKTGKNICFFYFLRNFSFKKCDKSLKYAIFEFVFKCFFIKNKENAKNKTGKNISSVFYKEFLFWKNWQILKISHIWIRIPMYYSSKIKRMPKIWLEKT